MNAPRLCNRRHRAPLTTLAVALLAVVSAACGPTNIVLRRLPVDQTGTLGPLQRCAAGTAPCGTDPNQDGSRFNNAGTTTYPLPACAHGIDAVLIQGANTSTPVTIVQCAAPAQAVAPNGGIPMAAPGGGVRATVPPKKGAR